MRIINLLPAPVRVLTTLGTLMLERPADIDPVEINPILADMPEEAGDPAQDLNIKKVQIQVANMPDEREDDTVFIVPKALALAMVERTDLFYPEENANAAGHVFLVHAASTEVLPAHEIVAAEHPEVDEDPPELPAEATTVEDPPADPVPAHAGWAAPGNTH